MFSFILNHVRPFPRPGPLVLFRYLEKIPHWRPHERSGANRATGNGIAYPEYHALLDDAERHLDRDYTPEDGGVNPFLHLSLHLAIEEQISIDQPRGIRTELERIALVSGSEHDAKHALLECLAETIWQAQRAGGPPDQALYLGCIKNKFRN